MDLGPRDRACIVTGASRGIGAASATALAAEGALVLLVGRNEDALAPVAERCRDAGGGAETMALDLTVADAGERLVGACSERFGRIDALINNAGTSAVRPLDQLTDEDWQLRWELHVMGPM